ncbi:MAG: hypothetical protein A3G25_09740 [Betaproteobacteria bacterium RIFCSPLOWO2_12_FULL_63_13]|nr:MAG: hypothetical protein A3G25_09740 [Betaproteobacteria bacterium RIFCSPLOWO2_12_FULL_63_13]
MIMFRVLALCVLWAFAIAAQAQVHKCIDASGKTTYSQSPCPAGTKSGAVSRTVPPAPPPSAQAAGKGAAKDAKASGPKTAAELEQEFRKRKQEQEKATEKDAQERANAKTRETNCRNARLHVAALDSGAPLARIDARGNRSIIDESQRKQERVYARKAVEEWCK